MRFLEFLQEEPALDGVYRDPDLGAQRRPARIGGDMLRRMRRTLALPMVPHRLYCVKLVTGEWFC